HNAPAQLERLRARLAEAAQRRAGLVELGLQLGSEADRKDRAAAALRESEREATSALRNLAAVRAELQEFRSTLQSELILSEREVIAVLVVFVLEAVLLLYSEPTERVLW
ncbi:unnamed protein product, partial [Prorocentrum cordatum]